MKQAVKQIHASKAGLCFSKIGLVTAFSLLVTLNVQADSIDETGVNVSMINQPSERTKANRELKALEEEYINATIQALNKTPSGPDYSNENVYIDYLAQAVEGNTRLTQPNFADEDIYVNYLVKILMK